MSDRFTFIICRAAIRISAALTLAGCVLHPVDTDPAPPIDIPAGFSQNEQLDNGARIDPDRDAFARDAILAKLIETGVRSNTTVAQARARLGRDRAETYQEASALLPTISATAGSTTTLPDGMDDTTVDSFSINASLTLDLFGEALSRISASQAEARASLYDLSGTFLRLSHELAAAYFDALEAHLTIDLLNEQVELAQELLSVTELRFGQGVGSLSDILQQDEQIASLKAQLPQFEANLRIAENRIDALMGVAPDGRNRTISLNFQLPSASIALGRPLQLLERRPDLQAAKARLIAADHRVAEAVADFFPSPSLSGAMLIPDLGVASLMVWTAVAQATQVVINGGRRVATVRRQGAIVEERAADYAQAWIDAIEAIENNSWQEQTQRERIALLEQQAELGEAALLASRDRYLQGNVTYVTVLAALASVQGTQRSLIGAKRQLLSLRLNLLRGLGLTPQGEHILKNEELNAALQIGNNLTQ